MKAPSDIGRLRFPALFTGVLAVLVTGFYYRKSFMHDLEGLRNRLEQENPESRMMLETSKRLAKEKAEGLK